MTTPGGGSTSHRRQWRDYRTAKGARPVYKFLLMGCTSEERAVITPAMKEVANEGLVTAKHLKGDIYEVKADTSEKLFAAEGKHKHVLLSLVVFAKKTNKTPASELELADKRLKDWRKRGA